MVLIDIYFWSFNLCLFKYIHFVRWKKCFGRSFGENGVVLENYTPTRLTKMPPSLLTSLSLTCDCGRPADVFQSRHPDTAARCFYTCSCFNVSNYFCIFFFICITRLLIFFEILLCRPMRGAFSFSGSTVQTSLTPGTSFSTIGGEGTSTRALRAVGSTSP